MGYFKYKKEVHVVDYIEKWAGEINMCVISCPECRINNFIKGLKKMYSQLHLEEPFECRYCKLKLIIKDGEATIE